MVAFQPFLLTVTLLLLEVTAMSLSRSSALTVTLAEEAASPSVALRLTLAVDRLMTGFLAMATATAICLLTEPEATVTVAL